MPVWERRQSDGMQLMNVTAALLYSMAGIAEGDRRGPLADHAPRRRLPPAAASSARSAQCQSTIEMTAQQPIIVVKRDLLLQPTADS